MNIFQRLNEVRKAVKYVQKDAQVQGYKAVSHDQVVAVARAEIVTHGIMIYPEQEGVGSITRAEGSKMHLYAGCYLIHFVNIDEPTDRLIVRIEAHAQDNGDKAPGKAVTYATKTAILKALFLETGEGEESRATEIDISSELDAIQKAATLKDLQTVFSKAWSTYTGKEQRAELTKAKDEVKKRLQEPA